MRSREWSMTRGGSNQIPSKERWPKKQTPFVTEWIGRRRRGSYGRYRGSSMAEREAPQDFASETWNMKPWKKLEQHVYRMQKRIYRASQRGNVRTVQKLEKLLLKSNAARLLAVRRVTQDNQGKKTAGIDGVKTVQPARRLTMAK